MGKKGSWFSALKRAFTPSSKDPEKKNTKGNKGWGLGKSKHGEVSSFVPLYRQPSSIEQILGDAEREQYNKTFIADAREQHHEVLNNGERNQHYKVLNNGERDQHHKVSGIAERERRKRGAEDSEREKGQKLPQAPPKKTHRSRRHASNSSVLPNHIHVSAIKIQSAYKGYMARKNYRGLRGLMRLQGVMRGQSVKHQTANTMRCMQLLVRVQSQIRARRLQMSESRNLQQHKSDKEVESSMWSLTHQSEGEGNDNWEDSVLTKDEIDARMQKKVEAVIKRERALAYAYSHQLLKVTSKSAHAVLTDIRSGSYPCWWNWLERHLPSDHPTPTTPKPAAATFRPTSNQIPKPTTPTTPPTLFRTQNNLNSPTPRSNKPKQSRFSNCRDDDSLTSCPAYTTVPRYMTTTASSKAKVRSQMDEFENERGKRRFSFGLGSSIGSMKWGGSLFGGGSVAAPAPARSTARHKKTHSIGGVSVDSTASLPVGVGRKPFR